ncbi:UTP--glucose-1-phosphate uridylyltransferase [Candidatus Protochlamydia sp. W-9]|uniref:UTP--glucose-1-phosphate uridylyltransferase n=1 Tax=Candidatus Protochlamydia sp. W-9 TaxID=1785087 RepID=UPI0009ADE7CE|nr:UTP--glucose-1-phosphate uridylyltransferase [Candidatus Protochlamydia sp. W-9]
MSVNLEQQIRDLRYLVTKLQKTQSTFEKNLILNNLSIVIDFLQTNPALKKMISTLSPEGECALKSLIAIGQGSIILRDFIDQDEKCLNLLKKLMHQLVRIDEFYAYMGGIAGYHLTILSMISSQKTKKNPILNNVNYIKPEGLYLGKETPLVKQMITTGIENLDKIAEIYPVGGAGDRLNLIDETTSTPLPAAVLPFLGKTLLEGLIRDLQAREYLYFKLYNRQIQTPIAMMTSMEKNNHAHILDICQHSNWFGRSAELFHFFIQPLVPVVTEEGNWSLSALLTLNLKPGGHGVIWKLAEEQGVFAWLHEIGIHQALVRQINNPLASVDNSIFGLIGIGCKKKKAFGFLSCERLLNSAEGTNVVIETYYPDYFEYRLTNIEYTDFNLRGIGEEPAKKGSSFSIYPTNTNILFVHIPAIQDALRLCPIPGQLINMKAKVPYIDAQGAISQISGGRLESTMQNIADYMMDRFPNPLSKESLKKELKTFIVFNDRCKTISTTKNSYKPAESPISTPENAYYDVLLNNQRLLASYCQITVPPEQFFEDQLQNGPSCLFLFHPALGPLYSIIQQKISFGRLSKGSELQVELAEVDLKQIDLEGSLILESSTPLGQYNEQGILHYGKEPRCSLHHVTIRNRGIDFQNTQQFWKNDLVRHECMKVVLKEGAEFYAEHLTIVGNQYFEVPAHHRLTLKATSGNNWIEELTPIQQPTWAWLYQIDSNNTIQLTKKFNSNF